MKYVLMFCSMLVSLITSLLSMENFITGRRTITILENSDSLNLEATLAISISTMWQCLKFLVGRSMNSFIIGQMNDTVTFSLATVAVCSFY